MKLQLMVMHYWHLQLQNWQFGLLFFCVCNLRHLRSELDDVDLENLTDRDKRRLKNDTCPICNGEFSPSDVYAKRLPCGHLFHETDCLLPVIVLLCQYFFIISKCFRIINEFLVVGENKQLSVV
jgi:hypothetical protein